jgi:hypothetical protein
VLESAIKNASGSLCGHSQDRVPDGFSVRLFLRITINGSFKILIFFIEEFITAIKTKLGCYIHLIINPTSELISNGLA